MKHIHILLIVVVGLVGALPMFAQDITPIVNYVYTGTELQRLENGDVVQTWTMPNGLETQQLVALLNAKAHSDDPDVLYMFDDDRMYHLRGDEVIALWLLRGRGWVEAPALIVEYQFKDGEIQRLVNGKIQQAWTLTASLETLQLIGGLLQLL